MYVIARNAVTRQSQDDGKAKTRTEVNHLDEIASLKLAMTQKRASSPRPPPRRGAVVLAKCLACPPAGRQ